MLRQQLMKVFAVVALATGALVVGAAVLFARADEKDSKKLDGEWTVVRAEKDAKQLPDGERKATKVTIANGVLTIDTGKRQESVTFTLDETTKPKSIDLRPVKLPNQLERGIYKLDGDELTICWGGTDKPDARPSEFKTSKDFGGRLLVLKKVNK
jgi:uncharacterized protein (TIGR03067 family)